MNIIDEVVDLFSCEIEYISIFAACKRAWFQSLLIELKIDKQKEVELMVDNITIKFHFHRDQISKDKIVLTYYKTEDQLPNILTKSLKLKNSNIYEACSI